MDNIILDFSKFQYNSLTLKFDSCFNLIEYLKSTNTNGNFVFHKDGISYSQHNNSNSLLNKYS